MPKNLIHSPAEPIASPPANYKGTSKGVWNGEEYGSFGKYKRTGGGVPERTYDQSPPLKDAPLAPKK